MSNLSDQTNNEALEECQANGRAQDRLKSPQLNISRRLLLGGAAALGAATGGGLPKMSFAASGKDPSKYRFGISIPFSGLDAYQQIISGYRAAMDELGGEITLVESNYDVKKQVDQINALVSSGVDALIVLPSDPAGVTNAVNAAMEAGVPTMATNAFVPNSMPAMTSMHDAFGVGHASAVALAELIGGKGKIGTITLPLNETWGARSEGMKFALRNYPEIEVVAEWPFDATLKVTPRDAADNMLTAHPEMSAIWAAWDSAAIEATLAMRAAGRDDMFVTSTDGGPQAFEYIQGGTQFAFTVAQSFFTEGYYSVYFAHQLLSGDTVPRYVINSAYGVGRDELDGVDLSTIQDYDHFRRPAELGWKRVA